MLAGWIAFGSGIRNIGFEKFESGSSRFLLGFFLGSGFPTGNPMLVEPDFHEENLLMVGAAFPDHAIIRQPTAALLQHFLQGGFKIALFKRFRMALYHGFQ